MYLTHPEINAALVSIGPLAIRWYSLMYIFGFLVYYFWTKNEINKNRIIFGKDKTVALSQVMLSEFLFFGMLGIILGGRLGYVLLYNLPHYFRNPLDIIKVWEGGMSFHGAFIGTYVGCWLCIQQKKDYLVKNFSLLDFSDITLVPVPLGLALGRLGNFINGELYGRPASVPWAMYFPRRPNLGHLGAEYVPLDTVQNIVDMLNYRIVEGLNAVTQNGVVYVNIPRHPSQLYHFLLEGMLTFAIQMLLYYKIKASKSRGFLTGSFLMSYGVSRIITEFFRMPDPQIGYLYGQWLTMGMVYSLPMVLLGFWFLFRSLSSKTPNALRA